MKGGGVEANRKSEYNVSHNYQGNHLNSSPQVSNLGCCDFCDSDSGDVKLSTGLAVRLFPAGVQTIF